MKTFYNVFSISQKFNLFRSYHQTVPKGTSYIEGSSFLESFRIKASISPLEFQQWHILTICISWVLLRLISELSSTISERSNEIYRKLPSNKQFTWCNKVASTFHAIVVTLGSLYILFFDDVEWKMWSDPIYVHSSTNEALLCISIGYFVFDTIELITKRPNKEWYLFALHHIVAITSFIIAVGYHRGTYWGVLLLLMEASNTNMNIRWYMAKLKKKGNIYYILNGITAAFLFFIFRIVLQIVLFWHCYVHWNSLLRSEYFLMLVFFGEIITLFLLNSWWFSIIVVRGLKNFQESQKQMKIE